jgi:ribonuclease VapC
MVIDTSVLIAILLKETGWERFIEAIGKDPVRLISAVNALEAAVVIEARKGDRGSVEFDLLMHKAKLDVVPFTHEHFEEARAGWRRFGKGRHPAGLNFCDCCAYALARLSREELLFKGEDFKKTDVAPAVPEIG